MKTLDKYLFHLAGKSDEKPTGRYEGKIIANGSTYIETDTGVGCVYDEETQKWTKASGSGGGGPKDLDGDGIDDAVATQDDVNNILDDVWPDQPGN